MNCDSLNYLRVSEDFDLDLNRLAGSVYGLMRLTLTRVKCIEKTLAIKNYLKEILIGY